MRTHLHARLLIPTLLVIASMVAPVRPVLAAAGPAAVTGDFWVDAQAGNDANNGLSSSSAFRTIQAAASIAGPGSTIHILPGVYRELVTPEYDGTGTARITYTAQNGPGTVKLRGSVASSSLSWTRLASNTIGLPAGVNPANLYYADLSSWGLKEAPRFVAQLNAQGDVTARLPLAREPDWQVTTAWKYAELWWAADGGSSAATCDPSTNQDPDCDSASRSTTQLTDRTNDSQPAGVQAGNLTTLGNLTGATVVAMDDNTGHYIYRRKIVSHDVSAGRITVDQLCEFDRGSGKPGLGWGSKYYVENAPSLLDTPGEWWYDMSTSRLYLWAPTSVNPATLSIEISRRDVGFQLSMRSYITIDGLTMEFFNDRVVAENNGSNYKSYNNIIRNATLRYSDVGIDLSQGTDGATTNVTDGFTLESSVIAHIDSQAINTSYYWSGGTADTFTRAGVINTVIRGNEMFDLAFRNDADNADGMEFAYPDRLRFEGNYVHDVAHNGMILGRSIVQSTKDRDFAPSEIKIGQILIKDNLIEKTCMMAADCGTLKMEGGGSDNAVHRDVLVTGNTFRNSFGWTYVSEKRGRWSGGPGSAVRGMGGFGLYLDHASGLYAYRNISYNNSWANIDIYTNWWDGDIVLYNNITANSLAGIYLGGSTESSSNTQIANNIIINSENYGIRLYQPQTGYGNFVLDYNLYFNNGWRTELAGGMWQPGDMVLYSPSAYYPTVAAIRAGTPWEDHGVEGDPAFATYNLADHNIFDGSWPDFHLTASSTNAIDRGTAALPSSLSALLTKFNIPDSMVGSAWDIGRYERTVPAVPNVKVEIGSSVSTGYYLASGQSTRQSYAGTANGPVKVSSVDGTTTLIAAKRSVWVQSGVFSSFSEMMGLPAEQVSSDYYFPWYNDTIPSLLDEELRFTNVDSVGTTVEVYAGGTLLGSYVLAAGASQQVSYPEVDNGPVRVRSTDGKKIIPSLQARWLKAGIYSSYGELMGLPAEQLASDYYFPWYNNAVPSLLDEQVRFGNVDSQPTTVEVSAGGELLGSYDLEPGQSVRQNYPIDNGPLRVRSTDGRKIIAAVRAVWVNGQQSSYAELMGLATSRLSTEYLFPWYNNSVPTLLDEQFRFGNVDTAAANIQILADDVVMGSYTLQPGQSMRQSFTVDNGVVRVRSTNGKKIIASMRAVWLKDGVYNSYNELMGLPKEALSSGYWFPWYDDATSTLDEQVRFGRP